MRGLRLPSGYEYEVLPVPLIVILPSYSTCATDFISFLLWDYGPHNCLSEHNHVVICINNENYTV